MKSNAFASLLVGCLLATSSTAAELAKTERFELHSDAWINLHHFLYQWSRADKGLGTGRREVTVPERANVVVLSATDRRAWESALRFYRESVAPLNHFDEAMLVVKQGLIERSRDPDALLPDEIPGIADTLTRAMSVYRYVWWPEHDRANRAWVGSIVEFVKNHEERFVEMTGHAYGGQWPNGPIRVDVSAYANYRAGYTAVGHITMYSTDPGNQGIYALEMLFHEVQHAPGVSGSLRSELRQAFDAIGKGQPGNLSHSIIFATAGAFAQSVAAAEGLPEHTPYWIREGFGELAGWRDLMPVVNEIWLPVVAGESTRKQAVDALVTVFGS